MADEPNVPEGILALLQSSRGSIKLPGALAPALALYLHTTLMLNEVEEVQGMGVDAFLGAIAELDLYGDRTPAPVIACARQWFNSPVDVDRVLNRAGNAVIGGVEVHQVANNVAAGGAGAAGNMFANMSDKEKDLLAMNITEGELSALVLSIETGVCCSPLDACDIPYGADPLMGEFVKKRNKAKMDSLKAFLDAKDTLGLQSHFANLIHDFTTAGKSKEAAIVTGWWMEVQQVFATNPDSMIVYVKEYLRRYRGRGFPVTFDVTIFAKSLAGSSGPAKAVLTEDQKDKLNAAKQAVAKVEQLQSKLASLSEKLATLSGRVGSGGGTSGTKTCNFCGKPGHIERFCKANPDSPNYDEAVGARFQAEKAKAKKGDDDE